MAALNWGLLWYEAEGSIEDRVRHAAARYIEKHDEPPNVCFVHAADFGDNESMKVDGCMVYSEPAMLKNHLWIGVNNAQEG